MKLPVVRTEFIGGPMDGETMYWDCSGPAFIDIAEASEPSETGIAAHGATVKVKKRCLYRRTDLFTFHYEASE